MKLQQGFTLVELLITVAIIGILAAVALPSYSNYVKSGNAQEAPSNLLSMKTQAEQHYADNPGTGYANFPCTAPTAAKYFSYTCEKAQNTFKITATGLSTSNIAGWTYTIDQIGNRESSGIEGVSGTKSCWITKTSGSC